jgi:hypothetical protein
VNASWKNSVASGTTNSKSLVITSSILKEYALVMNPSQARLSSDFILSIRKLAEEARAGQGPEGAKSFVASWGTHFAMGTTVGAMAVSMHRVTHKALRDACVSGFGAEVQVSGGVRGGPTAEVTGKVELGARAGFNEESSERTENTITVEARESWTIPGRKDHGKVAPLFFDLRPIDELLTPVNFSDPFIYHDVRRILRTAIGARIAEARKRLEQGGQGVGYRAPWDHYTGEEEFAVRVTRMRVPTHFKGKLALKSSRNQGPELRVRASLPNLVQDNAPDRDVLTRLLKNGLGGGGFGRAKDYIIGKREAAVRQAWRWHNLRNELRLSFVMNEAAREGAKQAKLPCVSLAFDGHVNDRGRWYRLTSNPNHVGFRITDFPAPGAAAVTQSRKHGIKWIGEGAPVHARGGYTLLVPAIKTSVPQLNELADKRIKAAIGELSLPELNFEVSAQLSRKKIKKRLQFPNWSDKKIRTYQEHVTELARKSERAVRRLPPEVQVVLGTESEFLGLVDQGEGAALAKRSAQALAGR